MTKPQPWQSLSVGTGCTCYSHPHTCTVHVYIHVYPMHPPFAFRGIRKFTCEVGLSLITGLENGLEHWNDYGMGKSKCCMSRASLSPSLLLAEWGPRLVTGQTHACTYKVLAG